MRLKRITALVAGAGLAVAGLVALSPASQAAGSCNGTLNIADTGAGRYYVLPAYNSNITCVMARGAGGTGVKALQRTLNACYGQSLTVDGDFGALTEAALVFAQKAAGVSHDGVYGPQTRDAIKWVRYNTGVPATVCAKR